MTTLEQIKNLLAEQNPYLAEENMEEIEKTAKEIFELTQTLHPEIEKMLFKGIVENGK